MSETIIDGVAWTDATRMRVYASRRIPNPAYLRATIGGISNVQTYQVPLDEAEWLSEVRDYLRQSSGDVRGGRIKGLPNTPEPWRRAAEAAIARCEAPAAPLALDTDVEAAMVVLDLCPLFAAMPYWLCAGGVAFALRALMRCHAIDHHARGHGYRDGDWIIEATHHFPRPNNYDTAWHMLRGVLAEAIAPVYDEAHNVADELRQSATGQRAMLLAFALPDEQAWADALAPKAFELARTGSHRSPAIAWFLTVASVQDAVKISTTCNAAVTADDLWTVLAHRGADGARVIEAVIEAATNEQQRKEYGQVLLAVRTKHAAAAFARLATTSKAIAALARKHEQWMGTKSKRRKPAASPAAKSAAKTRRKR